ncbi:hypothetical protein GCM10009081_00200 [Brevundimonas nasdae]
MARRDTAVRHGHFDAVGGNRGGAAGGRIRGLATDPGLDCGPRRCGLGGSQGEGCTAHRAQEQFAASD